MIMLLITVPIGLGIYVLSPRLRSRNTTRLVVRPISYWRGMLLVFLIQIAALVPVKVLLHWAFDLKYFIYIPEYWLNL